MSDVIFAGELELANISDGKAGQVILSFFRENPQAMPKELQKAITQYAIIKDQSNRIIERADAEERKAKFAEWVELFLQTRKSNRTREAYKAAFIRLQAFCEHEEIEPSGIDYEQATRFTLSQELRQGTRGNRSEQSIRLDISAVSSLYSELERLSKGKIRNPFLRLATKPGKKKGGDKSVPTLAELETILNNTKGQVRAAIACMAYRGLRIGALPELRLATRDGLTIFEAFTKGKEQKGELPQAALEAINKAGLSRKNPFEGENVNSLKMRIQRELDRLASEGLIAGHSVERKINGKPCQRTVSDYSCHSFRHFYATTQYKETKDIERVRRLLNHADLNTTQVYLQSLGFLSE